MYFVFLNGVCRSRSGSLTDDPCIPTASSTSRQSALSSVVVIPPQQTCGFLRTHGCWTSSLPESVPVGRMATAGHARARFQERRRPSSCCPRASTTSWYGWPSSYDDRRLHRSARRRPAPPHGDPFARRMPSSSPRAAAGSTCPARLPRRPGSTWVRGDAARCLADSGTMGSDGLPPLTSLDRREQRSAGHTGAGAPRDRIAGDGERRI